MCVKCNILKEETYLKMVFANEKGTLPTYIFFFFVINISIRARILNLTNKFCRFFADIIAVSGAIQTSMEMYMFVYFFCCLQNIRRVYLQRVYRTEYVWNYCADRYILKNIL